MKNASDARPGPQITFHDVRSRREGSTFDWDRLTPWQQNAVLNCHRLLTEIAGLDFHKAGKREGMGRFLPKIDLERKNNAVLIDGRRGSGKTIVLFTLLRYWMGYSSRFKEILTPEHKTKDLVKEIDRRLRSDRFDSSSGETHASTDDQSLRRPLIVPLGPVDLQYLSPHTQVIPLITGAFDGVVQGLREMRGGSDREVQPSWLASSGEATSISDRWRELTSSAASWEIDSKYRQSRVDPEEYFLEVSEMEKHRAKLQGKFRAFADALCAEYTSSSPHDAQQPLFVLCIDDADMKPLVSVRLLEALRVLYHPRVAFLLTGNSELFVNMLTDSFFAGLRAPLRRIDLTGDQADEMSDRSYALRLAREVYGKVIPTAHRVEVPRLAAKERHEILRDVVSRVATRIDRQTKETIATAESSLEWYLKNDKYTLNALPEQVREMWSLRDFVREEIDRAEAGLVGGEDETARNETDPITYKALPIRVAEKLWEDALGDSLLPRTVLDTLKHVIRVETHPTFRFFVDNTNLTKTILSVPIRSYRHEDGTITSFRRIVGYEMSVEKRPDAVLSSAAEGALILATDLAADYPDGDFVVPPLSPDEFDNPFVTIGIQSRAAQGIVDVVWPLPDWDSFVDFHIFSDAWSGIVEQEKKIAVSQIELDVLTTRLAKRFLQLVIQICERMKRTFEPAKVLGSPLPDWPELATAIGDLAFEFNTPESRARDLINTRWARSRAPLLLAPESFLEPIEAARFGGELVATFRDPKNVERSRLKEEIDLARTERLRRSYVHSGKERGKMLEKLTASVEQVIDEIDTWPRSQQWKTFLTALSQ